MLLCLLKIKGNFYLLIYYLQIFIFFIFLTIILVQTYLIITCQMLFFIKPILFFIILFIIFVKFKGLLLQCYQHLLFKVIICVQFHQIYILHHLIYLIINSLTILHLLIFLNNLFLLPLRVIVLFIQEYQFQFLIFQQHILLFFPYFLIIHWHMFFNLKVNLLQINMEKLLLTSYMLYILN